MDGGNLLEVVYFLYFIYGKLVLTFCRDCCSILFHQVKCFYISINSSLTNGHFFQDKYFFYANWFSQNNLLRIIIFSSFSKFVWKKITFTNNLISSIIIKLANFKCKTDIPITQDQINVLISI